MGQPRPETFARRLNADDGHIRGGLKNLAATGARILNILDAQSSPLRTVFAARRAEPEYSRSITPAVPKADPPFNFVKCASCEAPPMAPHPAKPVTE